MRLDPVRSSLGFWVDPADAFAALFDGETNVAWLDSGPGAASGTSVMGRAARVISDATVGGTVLDFLRGELDETRIAASGFAPGWVGWIGYETRFETMGVPRTRSSAHPDSAFLLLGRLLAFDHESREVSLVSLGDAPEWREEVGAALAAVRSRPAPAVVPVPPQRVTATWRDTDAHYLAMIESCRREIAAGNAYQLCLTTSATVVVTPDPLETYLALRASSPSHHGGLLRIGDTSLLSSSPEQFLAVSTDGMVESRPIKGTRPRGSTPQRDAALADELAASEKERAENLMIVDLMRNDIARVSRVGSVEVPSLLAVESYAQVHQLVSTVRGRLDDGLVGMDAVEACFPAGSMTGAPKSSATRILDQLEGEARGIYAGAFGYFGLDGRIDLAMVIRSIVLRPEGATVGAGGGITILSDPAEELAEVKLKAAAMLAVLGVR
jgi:para-aminobenzoate synthetase component 1